MTYPVAFWPGALGLLLLIAGLITHWTEYRRSARHPFDLTAFGPVFVGASLAAFAGEHFASAANLAQLVPRFLPGRLFIAYFVGAAHLAAALSFVARRYVRLSSLCLAVMFALF
ncbi:MAG TPA: hypothetical protein VN613_01360, partial [Gemmatimonadaceae bacterium]|nr:hypothetical protein [Gemmatimonadaceae bacterium]